jgi:putative endonuclease
MFVYILQSIKAPNTYYVGKTYSVDKRLREHNNGDSYHTAKHAPWQIIWFGYFINRTLAGKFENYLKTASGIAFRRKRLISS